MKQRLVKKLLLNKETVASLNSEALANVFGGNRAPATGYENDCITVNCPEYSDCCGSGLINEGSNYKC